MTIRRVLLALLFLAGLTVLGPTGCSDDDDSGDPLAPPAATEDVQLTCQECHTSEAYLQATALPDPPPPESEGEG